MTKNLFNEEVSEVPEPKKFGRFESWKARNNYRKADGKVKCALCENFLRIEHHCKPYLKCRLMGISASPSSDIRASYVCDLFNKKLSVSKGE
jgi:hypothetical protein